jgi:hypothetical protein
MILRPLEPSAPIGKLRPAWDIVQEIEKREYSSCWMITQPSHAALAGDIAAKFNGAQAPNFTIPSLDAALIRAIALHDAGWGMPDAQAVQMSRMGRVFKPKSFLHVSVADFLAAWTQSIEITQPVSPAGGYMVSRHFWRLAEHRINFAQDGEPDRQKLRQFLATETSRQKTLAAQQERSAEELESLTDLLQFCDLLSLYICSGAQESVEFPEYFGVKVTLQVEPGGYRLEPELVASGTEFSVAALRHPAGKGVSGQEISFKIW